VDALKNQNLPPVFDKLEMNQPFSDGMKNIKISKILAAVFVLAVGGSTALAQGQISGPFTTSTPVPSTLTEWNELLVFPQFNGALGQLTSVQLDFSTTLTTTLTLMNDSPNNSYQSTAFTELQITIQDTGGNLTTAGNPQLDVLSPNYSQFLAPGGSATSGPLSNNGSASQTFTVPSILSEFTGSGNIDLTGATFTQAYVSDTSGTTSASQVTDASLTGDVIYTFEPTVTPEPSTLSLMAVGLAAFGFRALPILRRKRESADRSAK
jgi:hypothetical protein